METTRLSTKGQVVLPKAIREAQSWGPGTEFTIEATEDGVLLRRASRFPEARLEDVAGCLRSGRKPLTAAAIRNAVKREVKRRHDRGRY